MKPISLFFSIILVFGSTSALANSVPLVDFNGASSRACDIWQQKVAKCTSSFMPSATTRVISATNGEESDSDEKRPSAACVACSEGGDLEKILGSCKDIKSKLEKYNPSKPNANLFRSPAEADAYRQYFFLEDKKKSCVRGNECDYFSKRKREADESFGKACEKAGFSTNPAACEKMARQCNDLINEMGGEVDVTADFEDLGSELRRCPPLKRIIYKNAKEDFKDARDAMNDSQDRVFDIQRDMDQAKVRAAEAQNDITAQMNEVEANLAAAQTEAERIARTKDLRVSQLASDFKAALRRLDANIRQYRLSLSEAKVVMQQNLDAADTACEETRDERFNAYLEREVGSKLQVQQYHFRSISEAGIQKVKLDRIREGFMRDCKARNGFNAARRDAIAKYEVAVQNANELIAEAMAEKEAAREDYIRALQALDVEIELALRGLADQIINLQKQLATLEQTRATVQEELAGELARLGQEAAAAGTRYAEDSADYHAQKRLKDSLKGTTPASGDMGDPARAESVLHAYEELVAQSKGWSGVDAKCGLTEYKSSRKPSSKYRSDSE